MTSHAPAPKDCLAKFLCCDHQVYSTFAFMLAAIRSATLFSNPCSCWFENGMLLGSAHTRNTAGSAETPPAITNASDRLRKAEDIQHAAFRCIFAQIRHGIQKAERTGAVNGI